MRHSCTSALLCLAVIAPSLRAQRIDWQAHAVLYGDNTEFFTPYRTGETILGGQVRAWVEGRPTDRLSLRIGAFADRRWGSEEFTDSLKPILAARYTTVHSLGVMGTLDNTRRHGLIDPLMVSTRELTTPIEYGMQWREQRERFNAEAWINWQRLNTPTQREAFEMGAVVSIRPMRGLSIDAQHLWSHRGGQFFDAGVPVSNNRVTSLGVTVSDSLPFVRHASFEAARLWSERHLDPDYPTDRPSGGSGTWLRGEVNPWPLWALFVIHWRGRDFEAAAGDPNYGSVGQAPGFYRAARRYWELGAWRRFGDASEGVSFDTEVRFHRIDSEQSEAFFGTPWELSYRIVVRAGI